MHNNLVSDQEPCVKHFDVFAKPININKTVKWYHRFYAAWLVFSCKAIAVKWREHNDSLKKDNVLLNEVQTKSSCLNTIINRFNSDIFIDNVCLSYRHDFGLMTEKDKQHLRFECKEWMRAISNNWDYFKEGL